VRGVGYYVRDLKRHSGRFSARPKLRVAIMGAAPGSPRRLSWLPQEGFEISALFDNLREKVGQQSRGGVPIYDIHDLRRIARRDGIARRHRVPHVAQQVLIS